jgi:alpha-L-rhamnosidase
VQPHPGPVAWAEGQIPSPHGALDVSWRQGAGQFTLTVTAPRGTSGDISVPATSRAVVTVNGRVAWTGTPGASTTRAAAFGASLAGGYVTLHAVPGGARTTITVG